MGNKLFKYSLSAFLTAAILILALVACRGLFPKSNKSHINTYCAKYGVKESLVYALIKAESNFNPDAVSTADAKGLMQLTDRTFDFCIQKLGLISADIFNPEENICAGVWYLAYLIGKYDGNIECAVAAYNAGPSNVDKWLSDSRYSSDGKVIDKIPFAETRRHVDKIINYTKVYEFLYPDLRSNP